MKQTELQILDSSYVKAANALVDFRESSGLVPGTSVRCCFRDEEPKEGIIAEFGEKWHGVDHRSVPIVFEDGSYQIWAMINLLIVNK